MPSFYAGHPPQYFEPKYEGHPSLHSSHYALHPTACDMDQDPYDHNKYPSSSSSGFDAHAPCYHEPFSMPHQAAAPMMHPLQIDDRFTSQSNRYRASRSYDQVACQEPPAQDEKITGGVSTHLDYEMEQMIDFVVKMTSGMYELFETRVRLVNIDILRSIRFVDYDRKLFRKWVSQVLNATRLPSATIFLSLSYLAKRVRGLSATNRYAASERALYQMLTVALILGSKFLDDNTFQNKSWSEVSNINVVELNKDEREWLQAFDHRLHHDPDIVDGFTSWQTEWESYKMIPNAPDVRLHPLDTVMRGSRRNSTSPARYHHQYPATAMSAAVHESASVHAHYTPACSPYESWYGQRPGLSSSPSTASYTGPNTPDYYSGHSAWGPVQMSSRDQHFGSAPMPQYTQSKTAWSMYGLPTPPGYSNPSMWNSHGHFCNCPTCRQTQLFQPRYGPVMA